MNATKAMATSAKAACVALTVVAAQAALAHHVAGFARPTTLGMGLLSGLGHPVIGVGSLAFLLAIGLWCAQARVRDAGTARRPASTVTLLADRQVPHFTASPSIGRRGARRRDDLSFCM